MRAVRSSLALVALVSLAGCATVKYDARTLDAGVSMNAPDRPYSVVSSFEIDDKAGWLLGLIPVDKPGGDNHDYLATLIAAEIQRAGGDAAINVTLRSQNQPLDIIVYIVTFGAYQMRTTTVTGDIIKYD